MTVQGLGEDLMELPGDLPLWFWDAQSKTYKQLQNPKVLHMCENNGDPCPVPEGWADKHPEEHVFDVVVI